MPTVKTKVVEWRKPMSGRYKCNCDGVSKGNSGPSASAFCVRNSEGNFMYAEITRLLDGNSLIAEAKALTTGLEYYINNQYTPVIMEIDSLIMEKVLNGIWAVPWQISMEVKRFNQLRRKGSVEVEHTYRGGNMIADYFANLGVNFTGTTSFNNTYELPVTGKNIINMEKMQIPNLRIRRGQNRWFRDTNHNTGNNNNTSTSTGLHQQQPRDLMDVIIHTKTTNPDR